ncbi:MAG TPA: GNAT family N-acetyltransferase [bacterium]|nr:GNAT family N-acetyltransferase [bacterium]
MDVRIRRAVEADFPSVYRVWRAAAHPGRTSSTTHDVTLPLLRLFRHERTTGALWIAEDGDVAVGYAAALVRSGIAFISELFVAPDRQADGIGGTLLRQLMAAPATGYCTMSSTHPGALTLYVRAGLRPRWPHFFLTGTAGAVAQLPSAGVVAVPAGGDGADVVAWDAEACGRRRPEDHAYWQRVLGAVPLWFRRNADTLGYGYVRRCAREATGGIDIRLGPMGVTASADSVACAGAAWRWAGTTAEPASASSDEARYCIVVPEPHGALAPLLRAGFRISDTEIFCCSRDDLFRDPLMYLAPADPDGTSMF